MSDEARLRRLRLRSWRRGIRETDLLLGGFADAHLASLSPEDLDRYEALLEENDHDLYRWISACESPPDRFADLLARVAAHAGESFAQQDNAL